MTATLYDSEVWTPDQGQPWLIFFVKDVKSAVKNKTNLTKNERIFNDMQLLAKAGHNITVGYIDIFDADGELLKETFDVGHKDVPCIRLVKDGRFHEQVFFQTSFALEAYRGFIEAVESGTSA